MIDNFYRKFEDQYRGSKNEIKRRLEIYVSFVKPLIQACSDARALDLGCGRGEWLELMSGIGIKAEGCDLDDGMLSVAHEKGLDVKKGDALSVLKLADNDSYLVVSGFHLVEHLDFDYLRELVGEALRVLMPGGLLILETPNPENIVTATQNFYLDPTHQHPIPSDLLSFVAKHAGFSKVKTLRLQEDRSLIGKADISLRDVISGVSPDYAVVAQKKAPEEIIALTDNVFSLDYGLSLNQLLNQWDNRFEGLFDQCRKAEQASIALEAIYASKSWRMTAPLRFLARGMRHYFSRFAKVMVTLGVRPILLLLRSNPALKNRLVAICRSSSFGSQLLDRLYAISTGTIACDCADLELSPCSDRPRYLYVDVTGIARNDLKTGIQRVVRGLLMSMFEAPPAGFEIKPVYAKDGRLGYCHASRFTEKIIGRQGKAIDDEDIRPEVGDVFLGLDFQAHAVVVQQPYLMRLHEQGLKVCFVVYDILPILHPEWFPSVASVGHALWLKTIRRFDKTICISNKVAQDLIQWSERQADGSMFSCETHVFPMGSDIENSVPTIGMPQGADEIIRQLEAKTTFLMVGTVEPRKGHEQVIQAFDKLWSEGNDVCLVVVGKEGWNVKEVAEYMKSHQKLGRQFFWLNGVSDEYLEKIYSASACLIAASYGEGYGLPLIEAARHGIPIFARDLAEFREVAGDSAHYFTARTPSEFAEAIRAWLVVYEKKQHTSSCGIKNASWKHSASCLLEIATKFDN